MNPALGIRHGGWNDHANQQEVPVSESGHCTSLSSRMRLPDCGSVVKHPPANTGDESSVPGWGRSPGVGNDNSHQYSCLESSLDRGVWQATVHGATKRQTGLSAWAASVPHPGQAPLSRSGLRVSPLHDSSRAELPLGPGFRRFSRLRLSSLVSPLCELGITTSRSCGVGLDRITWAKVRHQGPNAIHLQDV